MRPAASRHPTASSSQSLAADWSRIGADELIMTGLWEAADHIINHAVRLMEDEGLRYHDWFLSDRFARGYNLCFREVTRETAMKFAYGAFDRYGPGVRILQIVAPEQKGVFHWEADRKSTRLNSSH